MRAGGWVAVAERRVAPSRPAAGGSKALAERGGLGPGVVAPARPAPARVRQVPAVTRAVAILRHLGRSGEPLGVHAIARAVGIVPSTCLHILRALAAEEFVAVDPETKRYRVGAGLLSIA